MSLENISVASEKNRGRQLLPVSPVAGYTLVVGVVLILHLIVAATLPSFLPGVAGAALKITEAIIVTTMSAPFLWFLVVTPLEESAVSHFIRSEAILGHIGEGVVTFNERGVIESSNVASEKLFGFSGRLDGLSISALFFDADDALFTKLTDKRSQSFAPVEVAGRRRDGSLFAAELTISRMRQNDRVIGIAVIRDISERKKAEEQVSYLSSYDILTGLPNRTLIQDRLGQSLARSERAEDHGCVIFLDIDNINTVNETLGHEAGDQLLRSVAGTLSGWIRKGDTVGRINGNQFAMILHGIPSVTAASDACTAILRVLGEQHRVADRDVYLSLSMGVALFPADGQAIEPLLRKAEAALQHAKRTGANGYQFYNEALNDKVAEKLSLETSLRRAVENQELVLHYQPRLDLETGRIVAVEALARWEDPILGMVPPQKFIPLAEESGLIIPVGEWVLREACRQLAQWRDEGLGHIKMSVNVSPIQLRDLHFAETVANIMHETGVDPSLLELEITETSAMENAEESILGFQRLRDMGVGLAIDDFGTGYSSLSYLTKLPVDILKIDRSFVKNIPDCADGSAIARTIISMAHSLGLKVVAEGVESADQMTFLRSHSCQEMQGFLFSTAVEPAKMADLMKVEGADQGEESGE